MLLPISGYVYIYKLCSGVAILPLLYLRDRRYFASVPSEPISYHTVKTENSLASEQGCTLNDVLFVYVYL